MTEQTRFLNLLAELATPALIGVVVWFLQDHFRRIESELKSLREGQQATDKKIQEHELSTERRMSRIEAALNQGDE